MNEKRMRISRTAALSGAIFAWLTISGGAVGATAAVTTGNVHVRANAVQENAKNDSQSISVITKADINEVRAKSAEDVVFRQTGVLRTVDAMGNVGVSIRGAEPRHTLIVVDGQPVMGYLSKYRGAGDALLRMGAENIDHMEIVRGASSAKYGADAIGGVIDVHTKQPSSKAGAELGMEFRYRNDFRGTSLPMNYYFRGDTGRVGKLKVAVTASKRDIDPVNAGGREYKKGINWFEDFRPSLRYYGEMKNVSFQGKYDFNKNHKLSFQITTDLEDVERRNKSANPEDILGSFFEPMQIFKRKIKRDRYRMDYTGQSGKTDWKISLSYGKSKEDDITLLTYYGNGHDEYSGANDLGGVDWVRHNRWTVDTLFNTAVNDSHFLTYGAGYSREKGEGSRMKRAPHTRLQKIDPWDYDKSLWVVDNTASKDDKPHSHVHAFILKETKDGFIWDKNKEYYGSDSLKELPPMTYEEYKNAENIYEEYNSYCQYDFKTKTVKYTGPKELEEKRNAILAKNDAFKKILKEQNPTKIGDGDNQISEDYAVDGYFNGSSGLTYNGKMFGEIFKERENVLTLGEASIRKKYVFLSDSWQITNKFRLTPVLRIDNSSLFGSHITANLGGVYEIRSKRRLKMNVGTGYAEPGLDELYYSWQMFGGSGMEYPGWYWIGNPGLKPEKSFNVDVSLEGENKNTYVRIGVFHNRITDYLTPYFTGQYIDFNFHNDTVPVSIDRIYSFRNVGRAEITGLEAEVQHKWNQYWGTNLGYTWLHAVNKTDKDLPSRLLDRPVHKIDFSLNYKNDKSGFRASLWTDYYIRMLDSNSGNVQGGYQKNADGIYIKKKAEYKEKTFGIWNILLEQKLNKNTSVYLGVDNIFNHRDDDRAYQERSYRVGMNMKLNGLENLFDGSRFSLGTWLGDPYWFLSRYESGADKKGAIKLTGDYRIRDNIYSGENKAGMRYTKETSATEGAAINNADRPGHGFEQRLRLGLAAKWSDTLSMNVLGSTGKIDGQYNVAPEKGLNHVRLENMEINAKTNKWDFTLGRLHEKLGITGYWFDKEYDGVRLVYTDKKYGWQIRIGYGDFSHTTGVTDSAYNHKEKKVIHRAPTTNELFGIYDGFSDRKSGLIYPMTYEPEGKYNYREKFNHAGEVKNEKGEWVRDPNLSDVEIARKKLSVARELLGILKKIDYPDAEARKQKMESAGLPYRSAYDQMMYNMSHGSFGKEWPYRPFAYADAQVRLPDGTIEDWYSFTSQRNEKRKVGDEWTKRRYGEAVVQDPMPKTSWGADWSGFRQVIKVPERHFSIEEQMKEKNIRIMMEDIYDGIVDYYKNVKKTKFEFINVRTGEVLTKEEQMDKFFAAYVGNHAYAMDDKTPGYAERNGAGAVSKLFSNLLHDGSYGPMEGAPVPLPGGPKSIIQEGYLLVKDQIPAIKRAGFVQIKKQITPTVGLEVWHVRSVGDTKTVQGTDMNGVNVLALGIQTKLGNHAAFSAEYGMNFSSLGKYFHGGHMYGVPTDTGTAPAFGVVRLDIGRTDTERRGSWQAYLDYKAFAHGAFFGGTGADVPDRYLDGIRSFTFGFSYVPRKKMLLQGFYTFGAKGLQKRDTLYTPENFSLGDYTRLSVTYRW